MANICTNIAFISFNDDVNESVAIPLYNKINKNVGLYTDEEYFTEELISYGGVEIEFGSKWVMPTELLQEICDKFNCHIQCVSHEFCNGYICAEEFNPNK